MATITTTTAGSTAGFSVPSNANMDRSPLTGDLWIVCRTTTTQISIFKSTAASAGAAWTSQGSFTVSDLLDIGEMRIDRAGDHIHMSILGNNGVNDRIYYKRIPISSGTADVSTGLLTVHTGGTSDPRGYIFSACVFPYKKLSGSYAILVGAGIRDVGTTGFKVFGVSVSASPDYTTKTNHNQIVSTRYWQRSGDDTQISTTLDVEHNGDGITATLPNVWITCQIFDRLYCAKFTWQGSY